MMMMTIMKMVVMLHINDGDNVADPVFNAKIESVLKCSRGSLPSLLSLSPRLWRYLPALLTFQIRLQISSRLGSCSMGIRARLDPKYVIALLEFPRKVTRQAFSLYWARAMLLAVLEPGWQNLQPFVRRKNGNENFRQARIYNFCVKCVVFARNRKFAKSNQ